jgi:glucosylglycerate synthase
MTADIVCIGIPSWSEASTIAHVVRQADAGLVTMGIAGGAVIVNADNNSPDGTREVFQATPATARKRYLSTPEGVRGKGHNIVNLLAEAARRDAALVLLDADLESVTPEWIPRLLEPILNGEADFVSPLYATSQGGPLRNLICRPMVAGLFGVDVPQPTGGEMAFSATLVKALATGPLPASATAYGVDIYLTTEALMAGARPALADLGFKRHRRRPWDTITPIAREVTLSLFDQVARHRESLAGRTGPLVVVAGERVGAPPLDPAEVAGLHAHFRDGRDRFAALYRAAFGPAVADELLGERVSPRRWRGVLYGLARFALRHPERRAECAGALMPLFEGRMADYAAGARGESLRDFHDHRADVLA